MKKVPNASELVRQGSRSGSPESSSRPLFRQAALVHVGWPMYGGILLARPVSYFFLTSLFVLIAVAIVAFFVGFSYVRKAQVSGVLLPSQGLIRVIPSQAGVISERRVNDGDTVYADDILFTLTSERTSATQGNAEQVITSLLRVRRESLVRELEQSKQQTSQRMEAAHRRADDLAAEMLRLEGQVDLQRQRTDLASQTFQRYTSLQNARFISTLQMQEKQADLLDQQQRLTELVRAKAGVARDLEQVRADQRDLKLQGLRDVQAIERNIAGIEQELAENEARREFVVKALHEGTVTAINAEPGQAVTANRALAVLLPSDSELIAELYAPSRAAGFVKPGMDVLIRYQAYPYQKFGPAHGVVREVANTSMHPDELILLGATASSNKGSEPVYRIRVKLDRQTVTAYGIEESLRSGALLDASILLEKRRLYEWVLEPLYTITGRL
jgi:membrane fusion protein